MEGTAGYNFYDATQPLAILTGNLPHWRQQGVTYFVTFRLADSLPRSKLRQWLEERALWLASHAEPLTIEEKSEFWERFPARFHRWLDASYGSCILRRSDAKQVVEAALAHFHGSRYRLGEHTVMPNHVHAVIAPLADRTLSGILHTWKSYTAKEINRKLNWSGTLWQKESFDHIVRSPEQLERINQYIRDNPRGGKAK